MAPTQYYGPKKPRSVMADQLGYPNMQAGAALAQFQIVYMDGVYVKRTHPGTPSTTMPAAGMALISAVSGGYLGVLTKGLVSNAGWSLQSGAPVYVGSGGNLVTSCPTLSGYAVQQVGYARTAESVDFEPQPMVIKRE